MSVEQNAEIYALWDDHRHQISSRKGGWRIGEAVYSHGYSMMDELVGEVSYFQQMVLNITGRLPDKILSEWLEACFICVSWPDPRVWCNQMAALAGSSQAATVSGLAAGLVAADSLMYGPGTILNCYSFIDQAEQSIKQGASVSDVVKTHFEDKKDIPGYARPIAKGDERVIAMQRVSLELGFSKGPHERLAQQVSDYLVDEYDECINFSGYLVSFLSDQGYSGIEIERLLSLAVSSGLQACYVETRDRPAGSFLPMRCSDMVYTGKDDRELF